MTPRASSSDVPEETPVEEATTEEVVTGEVVPETETPKDEFYCPGCGKRSSYMRECTGKAESPHPPIEMVPAAELDGDPSAHTPAPNTGT